MMKIRQALASEKKLIQQIWYDLFLEHDSKASIDYYFDFIYDERYTLVLIEDDTIKCTLQLNQHQLVFNNKIESVSFVVGVSTPIEYQGQGYMKKLLNYAIEWARDTLKQNLMILQAYNWDIYRSFGFLEAYYKKTYTINVEAFKEYRNIETIAFDSNICLNIYNKYTSNFNGYKLRDATYFTNINNLIEVDGLKLTQSNNAYLVYYKSNNQLVINEAAYIDTHDILCLIKNIITDDIHEVILNTDIFSKFCTETTEKQLFMMIKSLNDFDYNSISKLYISEWV